MVVPVKTPETGLRRFELFKELEDIRHDMERMFVPFGRRFPALRWAEPQVWRPNIDMFEMGEYLMIKAELPGLEKKDIKLTVTNDVLTIEGMRKEAKKVEEEHYFAHETFYGNFLRRIALPIGLKTDDIEAKFKRGILEIVIPKEEAFLPKEIPVEVEID